MAKAQARRQAAVMMLVFASTMVSGCAAFGGRRQFAQHVAEGSAPILKGYRSCVAKDASLTDDEKKMRVRLADEFDKYVTEGTK